LFLDGQEIMDQVNRWQSKISADIDDFEKINQLVETELHKAPQKTEKSEKLVPETTPHPEEPWKDILICPYPAKAGKEEDPQGKARIKGALCELTLGDSVYLASEEVPRRLGTSIGTPWEASPYFVIKPGEFAVLIAHEYIYLPNNIIGFISIRNRYKQKGLINVSGFHVDPGFRGRLVFTAYNAGPTEIVLKFREHLFMVTFAELKRDVAPYDRAAQLDIPTESISALKGLSVSPKSLDARINRLEIILTVLAVPLAVALIAALLRLI